MALATVLPSVTGEEVEKAKATTRAFFFLEKLVSRDLQNKPKLAEGKNHS